LEKTVVTGQQIGLLGGPLYTTYKVLGAIKVAREIGGRHIYWLENNDADFHEINHIDYIDAEGELRTLTWDIDSQGYSCGLIEIDNLLIDILHQFFDSLRQTEFTPDLKALALRCYTSGRTLGKASCLLVKELFGRFGIELFDPSTKTFKDFMRMFLLREAEHTPPGEQCNLFCMMGKKRVSVFKAEDGSYGLRDGTPVNLEDYDLVPNVKTRNVCQDAYFDTHTYIAGPGEIKYIKELDPSYEFHGIRKADVLPRMSITLIEPRVTRALKKYHLNLQDVFDLEKPELLKKVFKEQTGFDYKGLTQQARQLTRDYLDNLKGIGIDISETGRYLEQKIKAHLGEQRAQEKARAGNILKTVENLSDLLMPFGKKQERVFNIFYYMNLYGGLTFIDWLYEHYDPSLETLEVKL
jgi:uncharacterized protein YllA (UPF0747 family)